MAGDRGQAPSTPPRGPVCRGPAERRSRSPRWYLTEVVPLGSLNQLFTCTEHLPITLWGRAGPVWVHRHAGQRQAPAGRGDPSSPGGLWLWEAVCGLHPHLGPGRGERPHL